MPVLVDTNVLLRSLNPAHPHFYQAHRAVAALRRRGDELCLAPQNLIEFWAVAARPRDSNGLGMSVARASGETAKLRLLFPVIPARPEVLDVWSDVVRSLDVSGKQTHDAHLVAAMRVHGVGSILTFNGDHFRRFGIEVLRPEEF